MIVMLTSNGYIKRLPSVEYRVQGRGGVGVKGGVGRDSTDYVTELFEASAHASVLMFTNTGRMFRMRVFELPQGRRDSAGKALVNFLDLREGERVLGMVPYREEDVEDGEHYIVMISAQGYIKRTKLDEFSNIRSTGIIAATIEEDDQLIDARLTNGQNHIMLTSARGMSIRFEEGDVRPMGRTARGVRGMDLRKGDHVVGMTILAPDSNAAILTMCAQGYGKRTAASDYKVQNRGGLGIITIKVSNRNGPVVGSLAVEPDDQIMLVTNRGKVIRTRVAGISEVGRNTQGVRVIRTGDDERVVAIERLVDSDDEDTEASTSLPRPPPPPARRWPRSQARATTPATETKAMREPIRWPQAPSDGRAGERSRALFAAAQAVIPGGVNSPVRAFKSVGGDPPFIRAARGAHLLTEDGALADRLRRHLGPGDPRPRPPRGRRGRHPAPPATASASAPARPPRSSSPSCSARSSPRSAAAWSAWSRPAPRRR
jgi:hypothetical protein